MMKDVYFSLYWAAVLAIASNFVKGETCRGSKKFVLSTGK